MVLTLNVNLTCSLQNELTPPYPPARSPASCSSCGSTLPLSQAPGYTALEWYEHSNIHHAKHVSEINVTVGF